jgi:serine protease Do
VQGAEFSRELHLQLAPSVLKIEAAVPGRYSIGSAVVVGPEQVVTSCHVTRQALSIGVLRGGLRYPVSGQRADLDHDLCLLHVPGLAAVPAMLGQSTLLQRRAPVLGIGYTGGLGLQFSEGEVVGLHRLDGGAVVQSSNWFTSGASGGGLFDRDGRLVGILTFRLRGGELHYYSAPVEWLRALLDGPGAPAEIPVAPLAGQTFWERRDADQLPFLRAAALTQAADWTALQELGQRWARAEPDASEPQRQLGLALERQDRGAEALLAYQRALALDPRDALAWQQLGLLQLRLGQRDAARASLARLQAIDPATAEPLATALGTVVDKAP